MSIDPFLPNLLFITGLSKDTDSKDIQNLFDRYGPCVVTNDDYAGFYTIEYEDCRDAKDALALNGKFFNGEKINITYGCGG